MFRCVFRCLIAGLFLSPALFASAPANAQDLADIIEKCERSVVRINVKGKNGDSIGSGFVVESEGVIVTNVHVLAGAQKAKATFANGESYDIEGTYYYDESRDICIAQLDSDKEFPTIVVSLVAPRKGETVTALGAPRGLSFTATNGIVSALRAGEDLGRDRRGTWIQIDAALSPGNSGGPLINKKGRVIAMSTLASTGRSQNLNFGISAEDIREAMIDSRENNLVSLPDGVGELETDEGGGGPDSVIDRPPIPESALAQYVEDCREDYARLKKEITKEHLKAGKLLRLMRRAKVPLPRGNFRSDGVIMVNPVSNKETYYFRSDRVKDREVRRAEKKTADLKEAKAGLTKDASDDSMFELLKHTGQYLDTAEKGSFGVLQDGVMLHPFNDHDAVVLFDDQPYLVWLPSTSGLAGGADVPATTVFVAGTETVMVPGRSTMAVTLLIGLKESELRKAVYGDSKSGRRDMRTWTAGKGKFSVEAKLVRVDGDNVTLEKADGKEINVPRGKLSEVDNEYIDSFE